MDRRWIEAHDQSRNADNKYNPSEKIRSKTSILQSDLCDYSYAYIVVKETITVPDANNNAYNKKLAFKENTPFISCVSLFHSLTI